MSSTRVYRVGVWFGFVRFALLLAVVLCWVDRCFESWVLLGLLCLLRVTPIATRDDSSLTPTSNHRAEFGNGNLANPGEQAAGLQSSPEQSVARAMPLLWRARI